MFLLFQLVWRYVFLFKSHLKLCLRRLKVESSEHSKYLFRAIMWWKGILVIRGQKDSMSKIILTLNSLSAGIGTLSRICVCEHPTSLYPCHFIFRLCYHTDLVPLKTTRKYINVASSWCLDPVFWGQMGLGLLTRTLNGHYQEHKLWLLYFKRKHYQAVLKFTRAFGPVSTQMAPLSGRGTWPFIIFFKVPWFAVTLWCKCRSCLYC